MGQGQDKYVVRLPDGMRDRIKAEAKRNGRSVNAEIVYRLEEAYPAGRDFFAMSALEGLLASGVRSSVAEEAYRIADEMVAARAALAKARGEAE